MRRAIKILLLLTVFYSVTFSQSLTEKIRTYINEKDYESAVTLIPQAEKENIDNANNLVFFGDIYFEMDKFPDALKYYKLANDAQKKQPFILRKIGKTYAELGKIEESLEYLNDAIKRNDKDPQSQLELANAYIKFDSLRKAELIITRAREMDKKNPDAYIALGNLYFAQKVYELARSNYEEALSLNENILDARIKLATSYYWLANREMDEDLSNEYFTRSLQEWGKVTQADPKNFRAFYEQGKIFFLAKKYPESAASFNSYVQLRPTGSLGRWYLAQALEKIGRCDSAAQHLDIVSKEIDSVKTKAKFLLARCYFDVANYPKAIEGYTTISKDTTLENVDLQKLGQAYLLSGDTLNAINTWEIAINQSPEQTCRIMQSLGVMLQKYVKPGDSIPDYMRSVKILEKRATTSGCVNEQKHIVYYYIGNGYLLGGKALQAIEPLLSSISADTTFLFARLALGDAYAATNDIAKAEQTFQNVITVGMTDTTKNKFALNQSFSKIANMFLEGKKFNDLVKHANQWITIFPNESRAHLYLAVAYHSLSQGKQACQAYRKVLQLDPKNPNATKNLKLLQDNNQCE